MRVEDMDPRPIRRKMLTQLIDCHVDLDPDSFALIACAEGSSCYNFAARGRLRMRDGATLRFRADIGLDPDFVDLRVLHLYSDEHLIWYQRAETDVAPPAASAIADEVVRLLALAQLHRQLYSPALA